MEGGSAFTIIMILKHRDRELLRFEWVEPNGVRIVSVHYYPDYGIVVIWNLNVHFMIISFAGRAKRTVSVCW